MFEIDLTTVIYIILAFGSICLYTSVKMLSNERKHKK
nr:MAG TPA: hypothetical protein [Bacteriophage sp.]